AIYPDEYVTLNVKVYSRNYDILYLAENMVLVVGFGLSYMRCRGPWKSIYGNFAIASALYMGASSLENAAIANNTYYTGSLYDIPYVGALCWFVGTGLLAGQARPEPEAVPESQSRGAILTRRAAMLAILSLPLLAFWALIMDKGPAQLREFRVLV